MADLAVGVFEKAVAEKPDAAIPAEVEPKTAPETAKQEEPDWKAVAATERQGRERAENRARSLEGNRRKESARDADLKAVLSEVGVLHKTVAMMAAAVGRGETDQLPAQLEKLGQEQAQSANTGKTERLWAGIQKGMNAAVTGVFEDPTTAPELADVRDRWAEAAKEGDLEVATELLQETYRIATQHKGKKADAAIEAATKATKTAAEKAKREALEEAGVYDTDTGASVGGVAALSDAQFQEGYAAGRFNSPAHHARAAKILRNL